MIEIRKILAPTDFSHHAEAADHGNGNGNSSVTALALWIQPRASSDAVVGEREGMVAIRLQAPPVEGAANAALIRFLAHRLGCPAAAVRLLRGERGRRKWVAVEGLTATQLRRRLLQA